jgi:hypothetical protein
MCWAVGRINSRSSSFRSCVLGRIVSVDSGGDVRIYAVSSSGTERKLFFCEIKSTVLSVSGYLVEQVAFIF